MSTSSALARPRERDGKHHRQGGRRQQDGVQQSGGAEIEAGGPAHAHVYQLDQREHVLVFDLEDPLGREGLSAGDDGHPAQFIGPGRGEPVPVDVRQGRGRHDGPDDGDEPGRPPVPTRGAGAVFSPAGRPCDGESMAIPCTAWSNSRGAAATRQPAVGRRAGLGCQRQKTVVVADVVGRIVQFRGEHQQDRVAGIAVLDAPDHGRYVQADVRGVQDDFLAKTRCRR